MSMPDKPTRRGRAGRLVDLIGPAAFPATYVATHDFVLATWATTIGAAVALALRYWIDGRLAPLSTVAGAIALATSLLALAFGSATIIEAEPTVEHLAVGFGLLIAWALGGRPAKALFGRMFQLTDKAWATLCLRFGLFAILLGLLNEAIRRFEPTTVWALLHFPGQLLLHAAFLATQLPLILAAHREAASDARRRQRDAEPTASRRAG